MSCLLLASLLMADGSIARPSSWLIACVPVNVALFSYIPNHELFPDADPQPLPGNITLSALRMKFTPTQPVLETSSGVIRSVI